MVTPAVITEDELIRKLKVYKMGALGGLEAAYQCNSRERIIHHKARAEAFQEAIEIVEGKR